MAIAMSARFSADECAYREMLAVGGVFVGDKWFPKESSEAERAKYLASFLVRRERNRRRRERRKAQRGERRDHPPARRIPTDPESQRANRMPLERRKCSRRSTLAECPTPDDIRTAWQFRNASASCRVRLGGMLLDLECFVDNSLITIVRRGHLKIVGRHGGLKAWIRDACPELLPHYKTIQRIKGVAKRLRQQINVLDPVPVVALMNRGECAIADLPTHVQPRIEEMREVRHRFAWELSSIKVDADGRRYFPNENYWFVRLTPESATINHIRRLQVLFADAISLTGEENRANETYSRRGGGRGSAAGDGDENEAKKCECKGKHVENFADVGRMLVKEGIGIVSDVALGGLMVAGSVAAGMKEVFDSECMAGRGENRDRPGLWNAVCGAAAAYMDFYKAMTPHGLYGFN